MDDNCPVHGVPFKWVPPGISKKTGRAYQGFWSCPEMGCKEKPAQPRPQPSQLNPQAKFDHDLTVETEDEKWIRKGQQMNRSNIVASLIPAFIQAGKPVDWGLIHDAELYAVSGATPKGSNVYPVKPVGQAGLAMKKGMAEPEIDINDIGDSIPF